MATEKQLIEKLIEIHKQLEAEGLMVTAGKKAAAELLVSHDVVPVVRCKDCRFSAQHDPYDPMECVKWQTKWGVVYTSPDGYCHKGERKDND